MLGNLSLTDPIVMASIYANEPPVMPSLPVLDSVRHPVAESPGRYIPALGVSDLPPQGSIRGIGRAPPSMAPIIRASVGEPQFRPATRAACFVVPTPLSPIPEESGRVESDPPKLSASPGCLDRVPASGGARPCGPSIHGCPDWPALGEAGMSEAEEEAKRANTNASEPQAPTGQLERGGRRNSAAKTADVAPTCQRVLDASLVSSLSALVVHRCALLRETQAPSGGAPGPYSHHCFPLA